MSTTPKPTENTTSLLEQTVPNLDAKSSSSKSKKNTKPRRGEGGRKKTAAQDATIVPASPPAEPTVNVPTTEPMAKMPAVTDATPIAASEDVVDKKTPEVMEQSEATLLSEVAASSVMEEVDSSNMTTNEYLKSQIARLTAEYTEKTTELGEVVKLAQQRIQTKRDELQELVQTEQAIVQKMKEELLVTAGAVESLKRVPLQAA
jgi:hypothetical protein